ncbi:hypothetical protein CHS0354_018722 [Potamilus streckersoni]|uniref:Uncharacterized protein n=1 Tax=Potamilus streckersoni TaxID=2493646 RepID=A0AAE0W740_9BIVA|nr:hypothetical protein CHS0354_018722 [Potamilus streckersoni]
MLDILLIQIFQQVECGLAYPAIMSPAIMSTSIMPTAIMSPALMSTSIMPTAIMPTFIMPTAIMPTGCACLANGMLHNTLAKSKSIACGRDAWLSTSATQITAIVIKPALQFPCGSSP